jgi:hypothetical protein
MSSHREAPEISKDPVADSTDVYAFVSPDQPDTLTLIANYIPLQGPAGGPNFYSFGDDVRYEIHVDTTGDARPDVSYQFRFRTELRDPGTFLYNTGPITALDSANWNSRQFYTVTRVAQGKAKVLGRGLPQRPPGLRRRRDHRVAGHRRGHGTARGQVVHAGRCGERGHRRADRQQRAVGLPGLVPVPRRALQRLHHAILMSVVLELGGDVGALVLLAPAALLGHEIEISKADPGYRTHSLVRERLTSSGTSYAAVDPDLPAGHYVIWRDSKDASAGTVTVVGGQVARFTLAAI